MAKFIFALLFSFVFFASAFMLLTFKIYKGKKDKQLIHKLHRGAFAFGLLEALIVGFVILMCYAI